MKDTRVQSKSRLRVWVIYDVIYMTSLMSIS